MAAVFYCVDIFILLLCLAAPWAYASGPGTSAANFLTIPVGARETALGGAFTAVADNADAVFYNPAGLGTLAGPEFSYAYNNYVSGVSQQWLGAAYPSANGAYGLGINYLSVKPFDSYDSSDKRTGSVSAYDLAVYLGYGGRLETGLGFLPSLRYGMVLKHISEELDTVKTSGYGLDAGLLLLPAVKDLRFGFGLENLASTRLDFIGIGAKPPLNFKAGVSYVIASPGGAVSELLTVDFHFPQDGPRYLSAGLENRVYGALALRVGYSAFGEMSNGVSFGLGLGLPRKSGSEMRVDYSYGATNDLGNIHKFALTCKFGPGRAAAQQPQAAQPSPAVRRAPEPVNEPLDPFKQKVDLLYGGNLEEARAAAEYLAGLDDQRVVEHFISLLYSGDEGRKLVAVHGFSLMRDRRSLKALESALRDADPEVRRQAALTLGGRGEAESAGALQEALKKEETDGVKNAILETLGKLGPAPR